MIRRVKGGYKVLSEKGKNLGGPNATRAEAEKRLAQVEMFKRRERSPNALARALSVFVFMAYCIWPAATTRTF